MPLLRPLCLPCTRCPTFPGWHSWREGLVPVDACCRRLVFLHLLLGFARCMCWLNVSAAAFGSGEVINAIWLLFLCWHRLAGGTRGDRLNSLPLFSPVCLFWQRGLLLGPGSPTHAMLCSQGGLGGAQAHAAGIWAATGPQQKNTHHAGTPPHPAPPPRCHHLCSRLRNFPQSSCWGPRGFHSSEL